MTLFYILFILLTSGICQSMNTTIQSTTISRSKLSHRWIIAMLVSTVIVAIGIGVIHYYRRQFLRRRILQTWESCDNDNLIS